jgi:hypothetical protein
MVHPLYAALSWDIFISPRSCNFFSSSLKRAHSTRLKRCFSWRASYFFDLSYNVSTIKFFSQIFCFNFRNIFDYGV